VAHSSEVDAGPTEATWPTVWPAPPDPWLGLPHRPRYAPVWARSLAWAIDWAILGIVNYVTVVAILFLEAVYVEAGDTGQWVAGWLALVLGGLVTAATILGSDTRQRLGDRVAGTIVV